MPETLPAPWEILLDVLILLTSALILGAIAERLRQSAILGYLVAGTVLGPNALNILSGGEHLETLAELGVALLLFTIGLEFSWRRLLRLGMRVLGAGVLQVTITLAAAALVSLITGVSVRAAVVIGAMVALSSTASVLRLLIGRAEIESVYGRQALGILLVQDLAVVPLVLMVTALSGGEATVGAFAVEIVVSIGIAVALFAVFYVLFNFVVPHLLTMRLVQRNRELSILLAIIVGLGSAWAAHQFGISPAMGAFVAGMLLAETPFATQIRADVAALRTLLITLFFSSIGMLGDPGWAMQNLLPVTALVVSLLVGKAVIIWIILRMLTGHHRPALSTGICLAQVGEFSFVLALIARGTAITQETFNLMLSATIATLFLTPFLVAGAPRMSATIIGWLKRRGLVQDDRETVEEAREVRKGHIIIVGYGPAGQEVAQTLAQQPERVTIVDLNRRAVDAARREGFHAYFGDAAHADVMAHLHLDTAAAVVITVPDPATVRTVTQLVKSVRADIPLIARARYHVFAMEMVFAGADIVIDEERQVGHRLAAALRQTVRSGESAASASSERAENPDEA